MYQYNLKRKCKNKVVVVVVVGGLRNQLFESRVVGLDYRLLSPGAALSG